MNPNGRLSHEISHENLQILRFPISKILVIFNDFSVLVGKWWLFDFSEADLDGQEDFGGQPGR